MWNVFGTGQAIQIGNELFFTKAPEGYRMPPGTEVPVSWMRHVSPANDLAREIKKEDLRNEADLQEYLDKVRQEEDVFEFSIGIDYAFGLLFAKEKRGEISLEQVRGFFPKHLRESTPAL